MEEPFSIAALRRRFAQAYEGGECRVFFAPGRVDLIGGHVDYHGGPVIPVAIDRGVYVAAALRPDRRTRLQSMSFEGRVACSLDEPASAADLKWGAYSIGALRELDRRHPLHGLDLYLWGTVPAGAGLSSSAALLVATLTAAAILHGLDVGPLEIARMAHRAETEFVGVRCGIMDQFASALARPNTALYLDCKTQEFEPLPLPGSQISLLVLDSMTRHDLSVGDYNERVRESMGALSKLKTVMPHLQCLSDLRAQDFFRHRSLLTEIERRRVRHVVSEVARVKLAREALKRGDFLAFGDALDQSHHSLAHHYHTVNAQLAVLQKAAAQHDEVFGARVTGAGFGGCVLAVVAKGAEDSVRAGVKAAFEKQFATTPEVHVLAPGGAPEEIAEARAGDR